MCGGNSIEYLKMSQFFSKLEPPEANWQTNLVKPYTDKKLI